MRPEAALDAPWHDLEPYAKNPFQHPVALKAAADTLLATIYVLLAWEVGAEPAKLVGFWALQAKQLLLWPYLDASAYDYGLKPLPVLNPAYAAEVMTAFLSAIGKDARLPKTILFKDLDASGPEHTAVQEALAGHSHAVFRADQQPIATREAGPKRSGSTRKKLRQDWNRLAATGTLTIENAHDPQTVRGAIEDFLVLEAKSWKGSSGTALLNDPKDAQFARRMIGGLADAGKASVALLKLDGRSIAAQVLVYSGNTAYTFKTGYDPDWAKYSPGMLLIDRISTGLLDSGEVALMDSCARGDSFMAQLWSGKKPVVDMVAAARPGLSAGFLALALYYRGREAAKALRDRFAPNGRRKGPAAPAVTGTEAPTSPSTPPATSSPRSTAGHSA